MAQEVAALVQRVWELLRSCLEGLLSFSGLSALPLGRGSADVTLGQGPEQRRFRIVKQVRGGRRARLRTARCFAAPRSRAPTALQTAPKPPPTPWPPNHTQLGEGGYAFVYLVRELPTPQRPLVDSEPLALKRVSAPCTLFPLILVVELVLTCL